VNTGKSRELIANIRNNERVNWHSETVALDWWEKLSVVRMPIIDGMEAVALSPHFRFYKYTPGQRFNMHKDGRQSVGDGTTLLTLLVYLNEGYVGGGTRFRQENLLVTPSIGKALLFDHKLWHQGVKLEQGIKYVLRTDIVFN